MVVSTQFNQIQSMNKNTCSRFRACLAPLFGILSITPGSAEFLEPEGPQRVGIHNLIAHPEKYSRKSITLEGILKFVAGDPYLFLSHEAFEHGLMHSSVRLEFADNGLVIDHAVDYVFVGKFRTGAGEDELGSFSVDAVRKNPDSLKFRREALLEKLRIAHEKIAQGKDVSKAEILLITTLAIEHLESTK